MPNHAQHRHRSVHDEVLVLSRGLNRPPRHRRPASPQLRADLTVGGIIVLALLLHVAAQTTTGGA